MSQRDAIFAVLAAGAVGYGTAWLIHGRKAPARSMSGSEKAIGAHYLEESPPHQHGSDWNQPRPSGDSPKPHGDILPNVVTAVTDNGERF